MGDLIFSLIQGMIMKKSIPLILLTSILSACGGSGSSDSDSSGIETPISKPVLTYDASKLAYFAVKHGDGDWQELDNKTHSIDITDTKGDISIITVCDETGYNDTTDREVEVTHLRLKESITNTHWCKGLDSDSPEEIKFSSVQSDIRISKLSIKGLQSASFSRYLATANFSDLSGPKVVVASGNDYSTNSAYLYRKNYNQLEIDATYTIDFSGADAKELETFSTAEEVNGFSHGYDYLSAITESWAVDLYAGAGVQGIVPDDFLQEGDLFEHYYGFGNDSQITVLSESQTATNPLASAPDEYIPLDFTISDDKTSLSFIPKTSPLMSLIPSYHNIYINSHSMEYSINAERFSEAGNTLKLANFSSLPNYPGDLPNAIITTIPGATSYFDSAEKGKAGSLSLFISSDF